MAKRKFNPTAQACLKASKIGIVCYRSRAVIATSLVALCDGIESGTITPGKSGGSFYGTGAKSSKADNPNKFRRDSYLHNRAALRGWGMNGKQADSAAGSWTKEAEKTGVFVETTPSPVLVLPTETKAAKASPVIMTAGMGVATGLMSGPRLLPVISDDDANVRIPDGDAAPVSDEVLAAIRTLLRSGVITLEAIGNPAVTMTVFGRAVSVPVSREAAYETIS